MQINIYNQEVWIFITTRFPVLNNYSGSNLSSRHSQLQRLILKPYNNQKRFVYVWHENSIALLTEGRDDSGIVDEVCKLCKVVVDEEITRPLQPYKVSKVSQQALTREAIHQRFSSSIHSYLSKVLRMWRNLQSVPVCLER